MRSSDVVKPVIILIVILSILVVSFATIKRIRLSGSALTTKMVAKTTPKEQVTPTNPSPSSKRIIRVFEDNFDRNELIKEVGYMRESSSKSWWVNSGAYLYINGGIAKTISGELPANDPRRIDYHEHNPTETDDGFHPQNIFRLVTKSKWTNYEQSFYFKIDRYILSSDSHRQASNGLLLFNHYQDGQSLYYAGLRVDGFVTIKKKYGGTYYIMSYKPLLSGKYNRDSSPNLIPLNTWIGIKTEVTNVANGSVYIKLYLDMGKTGNWQLVTEAVDENNKYSGTPTLSQEGFAGIRTDFMDVEFDDYRIEEISR